MNLFLYSKENLLGGDKILFKDPVQVEHIKKVLKKSEGETLLVGERNGLIGQSKIEHLAEKYVGLSAPIEQTRPPRPLPLRLVLAMQRPKMLKRMLRTIAMMGIKEVHLINAAKVEKSYWDTPLFENENWIHYFEEGLTQSKDTVVPQLHIHRRFKPFVEDELPGLINGKPCYVAHPTGDREFPHRITGDGTIIIGPEGGFTEYEVRHLNEFAGPSYSLGPRILRSEDVISVLTSRHVNFGLW